MTELARPAVVPARGGPPASPARRPARWPVRKPIGAHPDAVCGRSSMRSRMARKSPVAASRPWATTSTRSEPLHLVEHVAGHDDAAALRSEPAEQLDWRGLAGVEPGERLVEDHDRGVVHQGLSDLDPLLHALGVRGRGPVVVRVELDDVERPALLAAGLRRRAAARRAGRTRTRRAPRTSPPAGGRSRCVRARRCRLADRPRGCGRSPGRAG